MKRAAIAKRRDRRSGMSPYARHGKIEYEYSGEYRAWKAKIMNKAKRANTAIPGTGNHDQRADRRQNSGVHAHG